MNIVILYLISILHLAFIFFVVGVPLFINTNCILLLHAIIVPFMMAHWFANDNMCALTMLEKHVRTQVYGDEEGSKIDDCFTCRLIEPVYDFDKNFDKFQKILYITVVILWIITLCRMYSNYRIGKLNSFTDLFRC